jgi:hypothetical protein
MAAVNAIISTAPVPVGRRSIQRRNSVTLAPRLKGVADFL